jgi:hypothetical protein
MTPAEAIAAARREILAILDRLEASQGRPSVDPARKAAPIPNAPDGLPAAPADHRLSFRDGSVRFWEVGETKGGTPRGRLGIEWTRAGKDGDREAVLEYFNCFDSGVMSSVDPLNKGDRVQINLKPWKDTWVVVAIKVVSRAELKTYATPSEDVEIPF